MAEQEEQAPPRQDLLSDAEVNALRQNLKEAAAYAQKKFPGARMAGSDRLSDAESEDLRQDLRELEYGSKYFPGARLADADCAGKRPSSTRRRPPATTWPPCTARRHPGRAPIGPSYCA